MIAACAYHAAHFHALTHHPSTCCSCGAMSHQTKDCLERPRAKGAKWTNKGIAADEKVEDINLVSYDSKRDRWNGYDAKDYTQVMNRFEAVDRMRNEIKKKEQVRAAPIWVGR
jgi:pre-mRNA-processing factor SLU7